VAHRDIELDIRYVAIYLRKSRGEEEDLNKHRKLLTDMCIANKWRYTEYPEIGTSDSIDLRPQMIKLLADIEQGLYDAVLIVDLDRLSRGDGEEQARIKRIMRQNDTLVITPQKVYNMADDTDELTADMFGMLGRFEYKQIKKRFRRGKRIGASMGNWTNGTAPYPYEYQQYYDEETGELKINKKGLVVNTEKNKLYRYMLEAVLNSGISPNGISYELNKKGIPSPRGTKWNGSVIQRILQDETHLGRIISNKTTGDGHRIKRSKDSKPVKKNDKSEWIIVENCHEAVKTQEEHNALILYFSRDGIGRKRHPQKPKEIYPLSGLIRCGKCGHTLTIYGRADRGYLEVKPCWYKDPYGNRCGNKGGQASLIQDAIIQELSRYEQELQTAIMSADTDSKDNTLIAEIDFLQAEIRKTEQKLNRINSLVEEGYYTVTEGKERKTGTQSQLTELRSKLDILRIKQEVSQEVTPEDRLQVLQQFKEDISKDGLSAEELNTLYRTIISHITWKRTESDIEIDINFL